jgi:hypothetical protein
MALQINLTETRFGVPAPEAYARVTNFHGTKDSIHVQVAVHYNEAAKQANKTTVQEHAHYISLQDLVGKGDLLPAIYSVLKTMAPYAGSIDV